MKTKKNVIKKGHFYKWLSKVKKWDDSNLLDTLLKNSQFQKCEILKLWKFKVCTFENSEFQNFKSALPHINGV